MESWENKIIREKIESLQQLPAGYLPDLSSKWEIIEAGLPVKNKSRIPVWVKYSVAAAMIVGVFMTGIKMNQRREAQNRIISSLNMPSLASPISIQKEQVAVIEKPAVLKKSRSKKIIKSVAVSKIETLAKQENQQSTPDELKINLMDQVIDSTGVGTEELALTTSQPETPKRAKRRTFQKDFNDGLLVMDTGYAKPAGTQFSFRLQLPKSNGDDHQPSRRLQLKQVL